MRVLIILFISQGLVSCMLFPQNLQTASRPHTTEESELENLESLLNNHRHTSYETPQNTASSLKVGMRKHRVKRSLGHPTHVEVAGNPKYENERWIYEFFVPSRQGAYKERQVIYFEHGTVVGWESDTL